MAARIDYTQIGWVTGWTTGSNLQLNILNPMGFRWYETTASSTLLMNARAFEPSLKPYHWQNKGCVKFSIENLSRLSRVLYPGDFIGKIIPAARKSRHAIFVVETGNGRIYLPAMLLIRELWFCSIRAVQTIMMPNGLDMHLGRAAFSDAGTECRISRWLASDQPSNTLLRRMSWIAQCRDARHSWNSVLSAAHEGRLDVSLPLASLAGRAWGIEAPGGLLACELLSTHLTFPLTTNQSQDRDE